MRILAPNTTAQDPQPARDKPLMFQDRAVLVDQVSSTQITSQEYYRALWLELHTKENPTLEWFENWVARVPSITCDCLSWLLEYIKNSPPDFENWPRWTFNLHNAVNLKLGKPEYPWQLYQPQP